MLIPLMVRFLSYFTNCRLKQLWGDYIRSGVIKSIIQHFCLWIQSPHNTQKLIHYSLTMILLFFKNQHLLSFFFYRHLRWQLRSWFFAFLLSCEKIWKKGYRILLALNRIPGFWQFQTRLILKLDWQRH